MKARLFAAATAVGFLGASAAAQAQIKLGAILSISGPGAAMGIGYKGAFDFFPSEIAGQKVEYIVRDDATDASTAYTVAQKMISEDHIDAFIGPSLTASDAAVAPLANQAHVPMIAMAPYEYDPAKQPYTFNDAQPLSLMVSAVFKYMQAHGVKEIGYIGFSDGWGDQVLAATKQSSQADGIKILADERYARTDTSAEAQALKLMSVHPRGDHDGHFGNTGGAARRRAAPSRLQGRHVRQPWHRQSRLHQGGRRGGRGRDRRHVPGGGLRPVARRQAGQAGRDGVHGGLHEEVRAAEREPVRRLQL